MVAARDLQARWREAGLWLAVLAWTATWGWLRAQPSGISWHYFPFGARLLLQGSGLHLYARHPELQIGPVTFLLVSPLTLLSAGAARACAQVLMTAALPAALALLAPLLPPPRRRIRLLLAALVLAPTWTVLSVRWAHPDDVLALLLVCLAIRALAAQRPVLAGLALAAAVGAKPWAVGALPLVLLLSGRRRTVAALTAAGGIAAIWGPFLLADSGTLTALRPPLGVNSSSVLAWFGYGGKVLPSWDRTAQLVLPVLIALVAVLRRAWPGALLCAIAVRLVLDPQDIAYYAAGAALAAAIYDLLGTRWRVPWTTLATVLALWQPFVTDFARRYQTSHGLSLWWFRHPGAVAGIHLAWAIGVLLVVLGTIGTVGAERITAAEQVTAVRRR